MPRSESPLTPELQDELDRLDAALAVDGRAEALGDAPQGSMPRDDSAGSAPHAGSGAEHVDRELLDLVAAVRTSRPELDAGARTRLEERVESARRAPAKRAGLRVPADRRWRLGLALGAIVAVAVPLGAVVASDRGSDDAVSASSMSAGAASDEAVPIDKVLRTLTPKERRAAGASASSSAGSSSASGSSAAGAAPPNADRRVVRDVEQTVRIAPDAVARAADRVTTIVQDAGGYLDSSQVREQGSTAGGRFQVVVPSGRLDATVAALSRIGRPVKLERSAQDVTDRSTSLDDRLADLRADRDAARLQLARTVDPDRRAARRRELRLLSSRVASLRGQVLDLRRQTATSRIDLRLTTSKASEDAAIPPPDDGSWGIGDAWHDAGRVLEVGGGVVLVGGVVLLPLLLVGGLGLAARRRGVARRREATIDAA